MDDMIVRDEQWQTIMDWRDKPECAQQSDCEIATRLCCSRTPQSWSRYVCSRTVFPSVVQALGRRFAKTQSAKRKTFKIIEHRDPWCRCLDIDRQMSAMSIKDDNSVKKWTGSSSYSKQVSNIKLSMRKVSQEKTDDKFWKQTSDNPPSTITALGKIEKKHQ